ncbi:Protein indeterminate-domain like [Quillaja saponaria]|uniref:Protein indeterminate-domain like n=1 Tax=Quillaja saponaria TaxID=32244 RepID=A0AAD7PTN5_QUISA|nr:Protein indeterminate-domain like [Quillaja saponaria]KAJ7966734.1 Protein indeterminate-domain like [Quillaja saponaria]
MGELENPSEMAISNASGEATLSSSGLESTLQELPPPKKKRNLPGMPDPDAEVNCFIAQNSNGDKSRTSKEIRKRVYVCPEPSCVHNNPSRALGDLTGIKKHFCRKHGEKKWKCERCSKKYAVQSDWKAHMKTCGTKEYKCDCGTLFSRRDSFITHRAFCDALAEESARTQPPRFGEISNGNPNVRAVVASPPPPPLTPSTDVVSPVLSIQSSEMPENPIGLSPPTSITTCLTTTATTGTSSTSSTSVFASIFAPSTGVPSPSITPIFFQSRLRSPLFPDQQDARHYSASPQPALSATALLQKAAQLGAATSNASLLRGLGLATSSSCGQDDTRSVQQCNSHVKTENNSLAAGFGLGLPSGGSAGFNDVMMGSTSPFGAQPMTRDLLGLSMGGAGAGVTTTRGLSALFNSFGNGFDVAGTTASASQYEGGTRSSPGEKAQ